MSSTERILIWIRADGRCRSEGMVQIESGLSTNVSEATAENRRFASLNLNSRLYIAGVRLDWYFSLGFECPFRVNRSIQHT